VLLLVGQLNAADDDYDDDDDDGDQCLFYSP